MQTSVRFSVTPNQSSPINPSNVQSLCWLHDKSTYLSTSCYAIDQFICRLPATRSINLSADFMLRLIVQNKAADKLINHAAWSWQTGRKSHDLNIFYCTSFSFSERNHRRMEKLFIQKRQAFCQDQLFLRAKILPRFQIFLRQDFAKPADKEMTKKCQGC